MARRLFAACIAGLSAVHCGVAASAGVLRGGEGEQQVLSAADQFSTSALFSAAQLQTCPYLAEADQIKKDEGSKSVGYLDSEGKLTIGVGHLVVKADGYTKDTVLSNEQVTALFEKDLLKHIPAAVNFVAPHSWTSLPLEAQKVLLNMAFNLGSNLMQFTKAAAAVRAHRWAAAAAEFGDSKWCTQVKRRCTRLTSRLAAIPDTAPASGAPADCNGAPQQARVDDTTPISNSKMKADDSHSCSGSGCSGAASASPSPSRTPKAKASPSRTPSPSPVKSGAGGPSLADRATEQGRGDLPKKNAAQGEETQKASDSSDGASTYAACAVHGSTAAQRDALVAAAKALVKSAAYGHYSQDAVKRWGGIADKVKPPKAPAYSDCSSSATWVYWTEFGRCADFLNGLSWTGGNTATLLAHGKEVDLAAALPGDLVFYAATGKSVSHVAIYVGKNKDGAHTVVSHGSDPAKTLRIDSMGTLKRSSIRSYL